MTREASILYADVEAKWVGEAFFLCKTGVKLDLYNAGLKWLFRRHVLTLVILADLHPQWRPFESHFELGGFRSSLHSPICKILDHLETDWAEDTSLTVQLARAQVAALRTAGDPEARYHAKTQIVRNLYSAGYNAKEIRELYRLIDWMMHLRLDLSRRFEVELTSFEKEMQMPYVTSIERHAEERGLEKGREEGRVQGATAMLLRQLTRRCGEMPKGIQQEVRQLSLQQSQELGDALLDFADQSDLTNWLKNHNR